MRTFYVCSYGGCGSKMLCAALQKYGHVEHVHSRNHPLELEYIGNKKKQNHHLEWFNGVKIPKEDLNDYTVIYIYRNPIDCIYSRFYMSDHLGNIQVENRYTTIEDVLSQQKDLYGIEEFYRNYTRKQNRNYNIICVKYETIFENQDILSSVLNIGPLNLIKRETNKKNDAAEIETLKEIYGNLLHEMKENKPIM